MKGKSVYVEWLASGADDLLAAMARVDDIHRHQKTSDRGERSDWPGDPIEGGCYLTLIYTGSDWAAMFEIEALIEHLDEPWYECIDQTKTGAIGATPAEAINKACDRVNELVEARRARLRAKGRKN